MIHIFVGTKAQFIKMAPIMQELQKRKIDYNLIDAGQHAALTSDLIQQFGLRSPDIYLRQERTSITTVVQAVIWVSKSLWKIIFKSKEIKREVFKSKDGVCLIHGDTLTTLISLMYAKRCKQNVAHVEAGMRSYHWFEPFPEEIIRYIAMRYSNLLFAPSKTAFENLEKMGYSNKAVRIGRNTGLDAVRYALKSINEQSRPPGPYVIVTIHRVETIYSHKRLSIVIELLEQIAKAKKLLFVLHEPTQQQLQRFDLYDRLLENEAIEILPLQTYLVFVNLIAGADFVITDGGSIQEECYFLNIPCLVMRSRTEHVETLGENAYLAEFDQAQIERFFQLLPTLRRTSTDDSLSPSSVIVDHILKSSE